MEKDPLKREVQGICERRSSGHASWPRRSTCAKLPADFVCLGLTIVIAANLMITRLWIVKLIGINLADIFEI